MKNIDNVKLFSLIGLFWVGLGWLALLLAMLGFFYVPVIIVFAIAAGAVLFYLTVINRANLNLNRSIGLVVILSLAAVILFSHFATPSVFSGRDQGTFSNAAIILSQNHRLDYSFPAEKEFFKIYGPGTALNFPGFSYDATGNLVPHFPLGYISWLAVFYSLFGLAGFIAANAVAFFIFLISFYSVSRNYLKFSSALIAFLLVTTSFVFSWFFKFTLSENLALGLIWFGIAQFLLFLRKKEPLYLVGWLTTFGLLIFIRIEALAFLAVIGVILAFKYKTWQSFKAILPKKIILAGLAILAILFFSFKINSAFYITFAKGFLGSFAFWQDSSPAAHGPFAKVFYLIRIFSAYSLITYLVVGFLDFIYFLKNKKFFWLVPYFILLPSFIYLVNPSISSDHPWTPRRYLFAVIPISFLYTVIFLDVFLKKRVYFYLAFSLLFITNLAIFIPYLSVTENKTLLPQIEKLSADFSSNDLILVDRLATGDGWSMLSGPMNLLYGKQAVYFFNPDDIKKIDLAKFSLIYFIIPDENIGFYEKSGLASNLVPVKDYQLENSFLISSENQNSYAASVLLPGYQKKIVYGKIYQYEP